MSKYSSFGLLMPGHDLLAVFPNRKVPLLRIHEEMSKEYKCPWFDVDTTQLSKKQVTQLVDLLILDRGEDVLSFDEAKSLILKCFRLSIRDFSKIYSKDFSFSLSLRPYSDDVTRLALSLMADSFMDNSV